MTFGIFLLELICIGKCIAEDTIFNSKFTYKPGSMVNTEMVLDSKTSLGNGSNACIWCLLWYLSRCTSLCLYHSVINRLYRIYGKRNIRLESVPLKGSSLDPRWDSLTHSLQHRTSFVAYTSHTHKEKYFTIPLRGYFVCVSHTHILSSPYILCCHSNPLTFSFPLTAVGLSSCWTRA